MSYLDDLKGKHVLVNGVPFPDRKNLEFSGSVTGSDSEAQDKTTVSVVGGASTSDDVSNESGVAGANVTEALDALAAASGASSLQDAYDGGQSIVGTDPLSVDLTGTTSTTKADSVTVQGTDIGWEVEHTPAKVVAQTTVADSGTLVMTLDISGTDRPTVALDAAEYVVKVDIFDGGFWDTYTGIFEIINNSGAPLVLADLQGIVEFSTVGLSVSIGPPSGATLPITFANDSGAPTDARMAAWSSSRTMPQ